MQDVVLADELLERVELPLRCVLEAAADGGLVLFTGAHWETSFGRICGPRTRPRRGSRPTAGRASVALPIPMRIFRRPRAPRTRPLRPGCGGPASTGCLPRGARPCAC